MIGKSPRDPHHKQVQLWVVIDFDDRIITEALMRDPDRLTLMFRFMGLEQAFIPGGQVRFMVPQGVN